MGHAETRAFADSSWYAMATVVDGCTLVAPQHLSFIQANHFRVANTLVGLPKSIFGQSEKITFQNLKF